MKRHFLGVSPLAIVLLLGAAAAQAQTPAQAPTQAPTQAPAQEKCYGVARAGKADGIGTGTKTGSGAVDFQGDAWTWTPRGTCQTLPLPDQSDGTPRRGALQPLDRDRP